MEAVVHLPRFRITNALDNLLSLSGLRFPDGLS
jgi:hypothetical protein